MKIFTICGSMRYAEYMKEIAFNLESSYGYCVLQCTYGEKVVSATEKNNIVKSHYKKIDLSDGIYVVDIDGYIGESVKGEIEYARNKGKDVIYHSKFTEQ